MHGKQNKSRLTTFSPQDQSLVSSNMIGDPTSRAPRPLRFLGAVNQGYLMEFAGSYIPGSQVQYDMGHFAKYRNLGRHRPR